MPIEIPEGGLNIHQATDTISGILSRQPEPEAEPTPAAKDGAKSPPVSPQVEPETQEPVAEPQTVDADETVAELEKPADSAPEKAPEPDPDNVEIDAEVLAEFLGVNDNDLVISEKGIALRVENGDETSEISLNDLKHGYKFAKSNTVKAQKLSEERKSFESERQTALEALQQQQGLLANAAQAIEQQYAADWQKVDWQRLREDDPESYTLKRQDFDDRSKQVEQFKANLIQSMQKVEDEKQEQLKAKWAEGYQKLEETFTGSDYSKSPKWDNEERSRLTAWMDKAGYTQDDMKSTTSHLVYKWARDSMLRESEQKAGQVAAKKVAKLPKLKVTRPGSKTGQSTPKQSRIKELKSKQKKAARISSSPGNRGSNFNETVELIQEMFKPKR